MIVSQNITSTHKHSLRNPNQRTKSLLKQGESKSNEIRAEEKNFPLVPVENEKKGRGRSKNKVDAIKPVSKDPPKVPFKRALDHDTTPAEKDNDRTISSREQQNAFVKLLKHFLDLMKNS